MGSVKLSYLHTLPLLALEVKKTQILGPFVLKPAQYCGQNAAGHQERKFGPSKSAEEDLGFVHSLSADNLKPGHESLWALEVCSYSM